MLRYPYAESNKTELPVTYIYKKDIVAEYVYYWWPYLAMYCSWSSLNSIGCSIFFN